MSASATEVATSAARPFEVATARAHDRSPKERAFRVMLLGCLAVGIFFLAVLLTRVLVDGWSRLDAKLFTEQASNILPETAGAQAAILGSIYLMGLTALFCLPTGVLAAIYLEEYADSTKRVNRLIELNIQNLAAVPSVVYGILGLGILARQLNLKNTLITGGLTLSLLVLPVVIIASREAIRAVPDTIRQGSLALGATKWQTVWRQVLPSAVPGIATGSILALSRAIGEAAPLVILGIAAYVPFNPEALTDPFTALPIVIYNNASQPSEDFRILSSAIIVVLLAVLLLMNTAAILIRNRFQKRW